MSEKRYLNNREAAKELAIVRKYIVDRKKWLTDRERRAKKATTDNKKAFDKRVKEQADLDKQREKDRLAELSKKKREEAQANLDTIRSSQELTDPQPGTSAQA